ncbi:MAG: esterase/lipase family protein [Cyanophyceae cyanobacterium]
MRRHKPLIKLGIVGLALMVTLLYLGIPTLWQRLSTGPIDLHQLYSRSAQYHGPDRNPVILIPGMVGSALTSTNQEIHWGQFNLSFDLEQLALPLQPGMASAPLESNRVLESLRLNLFGLTFEQETYRQILYALGSIGGYRDATVGMFRGVDYGDDHFTCFQFPYDWRQDNVTNAQRLHAFVVEKHDYLRQEYRRLYGIEDADVKFDIVTHSMGGLLTRYFLRYGDQDLPSDGTLPNLTWAGARYINRAIIIATPNGGSLDALTNLTYGTSAKPINALSQPILGFASWAGRLGIGPVDPPANAAVFSTFPSLYQLIPRARFRPVVQVKESGAEDLVLDPFDSNVWQQMGWGLLASQAAPTLKRLLPTVSNEAERYQIALSYLSDQLVRARHFLQALDQPATAPSSLQLHLIAGDGIPTPTTLKVKSDGTLLHVEMGPGDGNVLRRSAVLDERTEQDWEPYLRSPIDWQRVTFYVRNHVELVQDPSLINNLLFTLLEENRA